VGCNVDVYPHEFHAAVLYRAYGLGLTVNSGYLARVDVHALERYCADLDREVAEGRLDRGTIYVVHPSAEARFASARAACGDVDGLRLCVAAANDDPFRRALAPRTAGGPAR
jgi:hypothetical protein